MSKYNNPPRVNSYGTYVGNDTANRAIPHGLGRVPVLVHILRASWGVNYHIIRGDAYVSGNGTLRAVTPADAINFYVGNAGDYSQSANANGQNFFWVAE